jgi:hypothetical protein
MYDQRAFPWWKYAIMGGFDSVAGICMVRGQDHFFDRSRLQLFHFSVDALHPLVIFSLHSAHTCKSYLSVV